MRWSRPPGVLPQLGDNGSAHGATPVKPYRAQVRNGGRGGAHIWYGGGQKGPLPYDPTSGKGVEVEKLLLFVGRVGSDMETQGVLSFTSPSHKTQMIVVCTTYGSFSALH